MGINARHVRVSVSIVMFVILKKLNVVNARLVGHWIRIQHLVLAFVIIYWIQKMAINVKLVMISSQIVKSASMRKFHN